MDNEILKQILEELQKQTELMAYIKKHLPDSADLSYTEDKLDKVIKAIEKSKP